MIISIKKKNLFLINLVIIFVISISVTYTKIASAEDVKIPLYMGVVSTVSISAGYSLQQRFVADLALYSTTNKVILERIKRSQFSTSMRARDAHKVEVLATTSGIPEWERIYRLQTIAGGLVIKQQDFSSYSTLLAELERPAHLPSGNTSTKVIAFHGLGNQSVSFGSNDKYRNQLEERFAETNKEIKKIKLKKNLSIFGLIGIGALGEIVSLYKIFTINASSEALNLGSIHDPKKAVSTEIITKKINPALETFVPNLNNDPGAKAQ